MNLSLQVLAFTGDVDIIAGNKKTLIEIYNKLELEGKKLVFEVNKGKKNT